MESLQNNATLAITDATRSTTREKLYQELSLESLCKRRLYRKYLKVIIQSISSTYFLALTKHIISELIVIFTQFITTHNSFKNSFFHQLSLNGIT